MHKSWRFGIAVKSIDRISSSIDQNFPDVDRLNLCGAGISETLANSINTILFSFLEEEPRRRPLRSALGADFTYLRVFGSILT
jgi:hypothetical protein